MYTIKWLVLVKVCGGIAMYTIKWLLLVKVITVMWWCSHVHYKMAGIGQSHYGDVVV